MNWITITWPMVAAACLTLGLIELRIGLGQHPRAPRLLFALSAFAVAAIAGLELALMRADTLTQWWPVMRGLDIAVGVMLVSLTAFIWVYFGTGNKWLALLVPTLYAFGLMFDYLPGSGMTYERVTGFRTVETFGGATFKVAEGVPNPWNVLPYLAVLMLIVFVWDASVRLWRRGERRRAAVVGGAVVFFLAAAGGHAALVETGIVQTPYMISWAYLAILLAMAGELHADVLAAAHLAHKLEESERRMTLATRAARMSTWIWEVAGSGISTVSGSIPPAGRSNEAPESKVDALETVHPSDRGEVERAIREAAAGNTELDIEFRVQDSGGEVRWIVARGRAENGNGQRLLGVAVDITERKAAEMQAAKDRAELRQMARVSLLGQLSASITHQLNQPLAAILGNAEAAQTMLGRRDVDLAELREICNDIISEDHRASQVLRRLGELYKRGRTTIEPLDLNELVSETLTLVHNELLTRNINVTVDLGSMLPTIEGDRVQLQQVLLNLIVNAADAMRETGIGQRQLAVRTETTATDVRCHVVDRGSGIAAEDMEHLFDAFWTTKAGGMGMGLALCQTIVAAHRGSLTAANNVEGGATFCLDLPIGKQP